MTSELTQIKNMIYEIRGQNVKCDSDLADLYGGELKVMNQAVKRNIGRFPGDFMFQLTNDEWKNLRGCLGSNSERSLFYCFYEKIKLQLFTIREAAKPHLCRFFPV
jgi:hypothetical protein